MIRRGSVVNNMEVETTTKKKKKRKDMRSSVKKRTWFKTKQKKRFGTQGKLYNQGLEVIISEKKESELRRGVVSSMQ